MRVPSLALMYIILVKSTNDYIVESLTNIDFNGKLKTYALLLNTTPDYMTSKTHREKS